MQVGTNKDQGLYNKPSAAVHPGALAAGTLLQYNTTHDNPYLIFIYEFLFLSVPQKLKFRGEAGEGNIPVCIETHSWKKYFETGGRHSCKNLMSTSNTDLSSFLITLISLRKSGDLYQETEGIIINSSTTFVRLNFQNTSLTGYEVYTSRNQHS